MIQVVSYKAIDVKCYRGRVRSNYLLTFCEFHANSDWLNNSVGETIAARRLIQISVEWRHLTVDLYIMV